MYEYNILQDVLGGFCNNVVYYRGAKHRYTNFLEVSLFVCIRFFNFKKLVFVKIQLNVENEISKHPHSHFKCNYTCF